MVAATAPFRVHQHFWGPQSSPYLSTRSFPSAFLPKMLLYFLFFQSSLLTLKPNQHPGPPLALEMSPSPPPEPRPLPQQRDNPESKRMRRAPLPHFLALA